MGPIYGMMRQSRDWLTKHGNISQGVASYLVAKQFQGMIQDAVSDCENPHRLEELIQEQTPGGLNEQALRNLESLGALESYDKVMDAILSRIQGKSSGVL
jgi:pyrroline-5-carboxylate reductase